MLLVARKTYLVDLASAETRATYAAVSNSLIGVLLLARGIFGFVAQALGTVAVILMLALPEAEG